jgi:hypothetical protein
MAVCFPMFLAQLTAGIIRRSALIPDKKKKQSWQRLSWGQRLDGWLAHGQMDAFPPPDLAATAGAFRSVVFVQHP